MQPEDQVRPHAATGGGSLHEVARVLTQSRYVVAMTGAGMSVESGIPTFRGKDGLWTKYGTPPMDGYRRFRSDPVGYWQREVNRQMDAHIVELREALIAAKPHPGHHALVGLERIGVIRSVVTQNIDGLDLRAGMRNLVEIHGNRSRLRCTGCGVREPMGEFVMSRPPEPCRSCGDVVKFDAVMFGEPIPSDVMAAAKAETERADCIIAIGTSATVRPASGLLWIAQSRGATIIEINPQPTKLSAICRHVIRGASGQVLPMLHQQVANLKSGVTANADL
ncbi:MAG: Sir2 family NAD-dependent protein deacetylase [Dehalococcoidia bacterium]